MNMVSGSQKYLPTLNEWGTSFVALFYKVTNLIGIKFRHEDRILPCG